MWSRRPPRLRVHESAERAAGAAGLAAYVWRMWGAKILESGVLYRAAKPACCIFGTFISRDKIFML